MNNLDINEIVSIKQMPIVFEQLEKIGTLIDEKTSDLNELECTEENKQIVKGRRTEINKTLEVLEDKRKEIQNKLLEPYNVFVEKYNKECKIKLQNASNMLKEKIDSIEDIQKLEKEAELREFVKQHCEARQIHIEYESIGLNVTLSASMKSLKEQALSFIEKVASDLKLIELEEYSDEIFLEYQKTFDFAKSKIEVIDKHKRLEELAKARQEIEERNKQEEQVAQKVEEIIEPPKEIIEESQTVSVTFTVTDTIEKIRKLKEFMKEEGINYE